MLPSLISLALSLTIEMWSVHKDPSFAEKIMIEHPKEWRRDSIERIARNLASGQTETIEAAAEELAGYRIRDGLYRQLPEALFSPLLEAVLRFSTYTDDYGFAANCEGVLYEAFASFGSRAFRALVVELASSNAARKEMAKSYLGFWNDSVTPLSNDSTPSFFVRLTPADVEFFRSTVRELHAAGKWDCEKSIESELMIWTFGLDQSR